MSYSIATLLTRNLHDVFGENDPARRRTAVGEIFVVLELLLLLRKWRSEPNISLSMAGTPHLFHATG